MKDLIYYENRFFIRLQELFSERARKEILRSERAELYHFISYEKYKLFIRKARKDYEVCGENIEELNKFDLFEKVEILKIKQFYKVYYKGDYNSCRKFFDECIWRMYKNELFISVIPGNKRQKRK